MSPELALVDRELAAHVHEACRATDPTPTAVELQGTNAHEAMLRICELSDVNPPRTRRRVLAVAVPAALWVEALVLAASLVPFGAL